ncbi:MAG: hypothetical protein IJR88_06435 [Clostridia bacterium]|nr:hypothetical protein [Clostridia bacterium]
MKKTFGFYTLLWAILFAVFHLAVFFARPIIPGYVILYDARFWVAWGFIVAAFLVNLLCAGFAFKAENLSKTFYRLSLVKVSRILLLSLLVGGVALMLIPNLPAWIAVVVCALLMLFNAFAVIKALFAAGTVERIDQKIKVKTAFVKFLTADAQSTMARAESEEAKELCKQVYEAVRYSDPMSDEALEPIESAIAAQFRAFDEAICDGDVELAAALSKELLALIGDRNNKCKALK